MGLFDMFKSNVELTPKVALCAGMIYMIASDGNIEQEEILYLNTIINDESTIQNAIKYIKSKDYDTFLQEANGLLDDKQKVVVIANVLDVLFSDGSAANEEQAMFAKMLSAFGKSEDDIRQIFDVIMLKNDKSIF